MPGPRKSRRASSPQGLRCSAARAAAAPLIFTAHRLGHRLYPGEHAAVEIAGTKTRRDFIVDNPPGEQIGQPPLQSVADLDADLPLVAGDEQQGAVVLPLLADSPGFRHLQGIAFHRLPLQGRDGQHDDLGRIALLETAEELLQFLLRRRGEDVGAVVDVTARRGDLQRRRGQRQQQKTKKAGRCGTSASVKLDLRCLLGSGLRLEWLFAFQVQQEIVRQVVGKGADGGIEDLHRLIIALAGDVDAVFRSFQLMLQIEKILVGFQVGIAFGHHQQAGQGTGELPLRLLVFLHGGRVGEIAAADVDLPDLGPGIGDRFERFPLVGGVGFHRLDQIGNQVGSALVSGFHIRPGGGDAFLVLLDLVVAAAGEGEQEKEKKQESDWTRRAFEPPWSDFENGVEYSPRRARL